MPQHNRESNGQSWGSDFGLEFRKILEDFQAIRLAFFRMELGGEKFALRDCRAERTSIIGLESDNAWVVWNHIIGVDEVKKTAIGNAGQRFCRLFDRAAVPAHVGNLQRRWQFETHHFATQNSQA